MSSIDRKCFTRAIKRIQERVGISEWTAHDLRRTFANQLGEALQIDPVVMRNVWDIKCHESWQLIINEMLPQRKEALEQWSHYIHNLMANNIVYLNIKAK
ncbi:integrase [Legionella taurinensis]|nr:integrase [Legionella taurinensis]